jgi:hypothetical protein
MAVTLWPTRLCHEHPGNSVLPASSSWLAECQWHPLKRRVNAPLEKPPVLRPAAWGWSVEIVSKLPWFGTHEVYIAGVPCAYSIDPCGAWEQCSAVGYVWYNTLRKCILCSRSRPQFSALGPLARSHLPPAALLFFLLRSPVICTREALSIHQSCADKTWPLFLNHSTLSLTYSHCLIDTPFHPS